MRLFFILIGWSLFIGFQSCKKGNTKPNIIIVEDGSKPYRGVMHLNKDHWKMKIFIQENSLNDTALFGGNIKLVPGKTGTLYSGECLMDSMPFIYHPYKATTGRLVVEYSSEKGY
jgi:hypothetical protein